MNIIEAIKEFQTGKYEYMTNTYDIRLKYTLSSNGYGFLMCNNIESWLHTYQLEGWEMGPKKKEKKTGWINIYRDCSGQQIFPTKEMARDAAWEIPTDTIEITWYE